MRKVGRVEGKARVEEREETRGLISSLCDNVIRPELWRYWRHPTSGSVLAVTSVHTWTLDMVYWGNEDIENIQH